MALRRTTKQKLYRYTVYAVLIVIFIWAIASATGRNWDRCSSTPRSR